MYNIIFSKEMAKTFACDCYDLIIQQIKADEAMEQKVESLSENGEDNQIYSEGRVA